jgi:hypothetical protein
MENTITFIYHPYIYFESYKNVLQNVRKHYEDSEVFIYFDSDREDIEKYKTIANDYNCIFIVRETPMGYINRTDSHDINKVKISEWVDRLVDASKTTNSKWILNLEDDVVIKRKILDFPQSNVGTCRNYFRPGGGSIFDKNKFLESVQNTNVSKLIDIVPKANWAGDVLLETIFKKNGATFEEWDELAEPNCRDNEDHAVYHGYKELHKFR